MLEAEHMKTLLSKHASCWLEKRFPVKPVVVQLNMADDVVVIRDKQGRGGGGWGKQEYTEHMQHGPVWEVHSDEAIKPPARANKTSIIW